MAEMTREEVEERLEEYAAHKAIKDAHEDAEDLPLEVDNETMGNEECAFLFKSVQHLSELKL